MGKPAWRALLVALGVLGAAAVARAAEVNFIIVDPRRPLNVGPAEPVIRPGRWLGLFKRGGGYALQSVEVAVQVKSAGLRPEAHLSFGSATRPVFIVRNIAGLKPGPVRTSFVGAADLVPGRFFRWQLGRNQPPYFLLPLGSVDLATPAEGESGVLVDVKAYRLVLVHGDQSQTLLQPDYPPDEIWSRLALEGYALSNHTRLIWAGDLDRDGKLDLVLSWSPHWAVDGYDLLLSSAAEPGQLVKKVADFAFFND